MANLLATLNQLRFIAPNVPGDKDDDALQLLLDGAAAMYLVLTGETYASAAAVPADVTVAVCRQAAFQWSQRDRIGVMSRSDAAGHNTSFVALDALDPYFKAVVDSHRGYA